MTDLNIQTKVAVVTIVDNTFLEMVFHKDQKYRISGEDATEITQCISKLSLDYSSDFPLLIIGHKNISFSIPALKQFAKLKCCKRRALLLRGMNVPMNKILTIITKINPKFRLAMFINKKNAIKWLLKK